MLSAKQGSCEYHFVKSFGMTQFSSSLEKFSYMIFDIDFARHNYAKESSNNLTSCDGPSNMISLF